jgi:hypothetical protein
MTLYHTVTVKCQSLYSVRVKMTAHLSGKHLYVNTLWFKVMRTPASPELV